MSILNEIKEGDPIRITYTYDNGARCIMEGPATRGLFGEWTPKTTNSNEISVERIEP